MTEPSDSGTPETDAQPEWRFLNDGFDFRVVTRKFAASLETRLIAAQAKHRAERAEAELAELRSALTESVRLQSHYASLLNQYDGGNRKGFADASEWVERLKRIMTKGYGNG